MVLTVNDSACRRLQKLRYRTLTDLKSSLPIASLVTVSLIGCSELPTRPPKNPPNLVKKLIVRPAIAALEPGDTLRLLGLPTDGQGNRVLGVVVDWSSSDERIARVDSAGLVTGVAAGDATIRAEVESKEGTVALHVFTPVREVSVSPDSASLEFGGELQLTAFATDSAGQPIIDRVAAWSVADSAIARVDAVGRVTGIEAGSTQIVARFAGETDTATIVVDPFGTLATVVVSEYSSCGLTSGGAAYCWGYNRGGQLGLGWPETDHPIPRPVVGGLTFVSIVAGREAYCGLTSSGEAYCWGRNDLGNLGAVSTEMCHSFPCNPRPIRAADGLVFSSLHTGLGHTCGVTAQQEAYCWGSNRDGELGSGSIGDGGPNPALVVGNIAWEEVVGGGGHTCGLDSAGAAYCWGGASEDSVPKKLGGGLTFRSIFAGSNDTCGISGQDALFCWSDGDSIPQAFFTQERFQSLSLGRSSCGITTVGTTVCWGVNDWGQLGSWTVGGQSDVPVPVLGGHAFVTVAIFLTHACGAGAEGAFCWGYNRNGGLGNHAAGVASPPPIRVAGQVP